MSATAARKIEDALAYLCRADVASFDAYVINALERVPVPGLGTYMVAPMGHRYVLMYDPQHADKSPMPMLNAIMRHEVLHIILNHTYRALQLAETIEDPDAKELYWSIKPIAIDMAVDEYVRQSEPKIAAPDRPYGPWILAEDFGLPRDKSFEEYVTLLAPRYRKDRERQRRIHERMRDMMLDWARGLPEDFECPPNTMMHELLEQIRKERTDANAAE